MKKLLLSLLLLLTFSTANARVVDLEGTREQADVQVLKIDTKRTVYFSGVVTMGSVEAFKRQLTSLYVQDKKKEIFIVINSPGGFVSDGLSALHLMDTVMKSAPLTCVIANKAFSMAAIMGTNCTKVYMEQDSAFLFHEAYTSWDGKMSPTAAIQTGMSLVMLNLKLAEIVGRNLGMLVNDYLELIIETEWILNPAEAYRVGLSDGTVELDYN